MSYTLGQAARATGMSKPTIARAIQKGKVSATRGDDGAYVIDPAELHRVYPLTGKSNGTMKQSVTGETDTAAPVADGYLDQLLREYQETIRDLRARLDASETRFTALLAEQRPVRRSWWRRMFGRG